MPIHLNADAPNANDVPTLHALEYMTLDEFCRIVGIDFSQTRDVLHESDVTWGGLGFTFAEASTICRICQVGLPESLPPDRMVYVG